jgi:hypothetical protein
VLVLAQRRRQFIIELFLKHQLVLVPLLKLEPFVLELTIIQLQLVRHRLMGLPQRFEQQLQQLVLQLKLLQQQLVKEFFLPQFRRQLSLQVRRLQELRHQFQNQFIGIQLQLRIKKFMQDSKLEIIA